MWKEAFNFPDYYGANMDAWIDFMSDLIIDEEMLLIEITETENFNARLPEIFDAVLECSSFVNKRFVESNEFSKVAYIFL